MTTLKQLDPKQLAFLADRIISAGRIAYADPHGFTMRYLNAGDLYFTMSISAHDPKSDPRCDCMTASRRGWPYDCEFAIKLHGAWSSTIIDESQAALLPLLHEALRVLGYESPRYYLDHDYDQHLLAIPVAMQLECEYLGIKAVEAQEQADSADEEGGDADVTERAAAARWNFDAFVAKHCVIADYRNGGRLTFTDARFDALPLAKTMDEREAEDRRHHRSLVPGAGARATSCLSHRCDEGNL